MLFTNDELKSVFDFEHNPEDIPDNMASVAALAQEIKRVIDKLCDIIEKNDEKNHPSTAAYFYNQNALAA